MEIHCLGLSHKSAPLELIEQLQMTDEQLGAALARCGCWDGNIDKELLELALVSTCNRVEIYAILAGDDPEPLRGLLAESAGIAQGKLDGNLYHHTGLKAVRHLLEVAAGLDSMVVGEPQILGQVADAYSNSLKAGASGVIMSKVFHAAIHAGKRARTETEIAANPASISSVAIHFASQHVEDLTSANVVVLGAGEMAELAVEALRKRGARRITVVNRTVSRAKELAQRWQATPKPFEQMASALQAADILIASTGAPHAILEFDFVETVMKSRSDRPLVILDIAVPRDVEAEVNQLDGVHLFDLDHLQGHLEGSLGKRKGEVPLVRSILEEEMASFRDWYSSLGIRPLIAELHQRAEDIRLQEMERTLGSLANLDPDEREKISAMTRALVKKLLHAPTMRLKEQSRQGSAAAYALVARDLFDLGPQDIDPAFPHRRNQ